MGQQNFSAWKNFCLLSKTVTRIPLESSGAWLLLNHHIVKSSKAQITDVSHILQWSTITKSDMQQCVQLDVYCDVIVIHQYYVYLLSFIGLHFHPEIQCVVLQVLRIFDQVMG